MKIIKNENADWQIRESYRKKIFFDEKDMAQPGTLAQMVRVDPGDKVEPHYHHSTYEVIYVVEGEAQMTIKDQTTQTLPGDLILTEPGDVHSVHNNSDRPWKVIVFKTNHKPDDSTWIDQ